PVEQALVGSEHLNEARSRPRRRKESLELVERFARVRTLPERVQERGKEPLQGAPQGTRIGHQRPSLDDEAEVVARSLGIGEARRAQGHQTRKPEPRGDARSPLAEELAERAMDGPRDAPMPALEAPHGPRGRPRDPDAASETGEGLGLPWQGV